MFMQCIFSFDIDIIHSIYIYALAFLLYTLIILIFKINISIHYDGTFRLKLLQKRETGLGAQHIFSGLSKYHFSLVMVHIPLAQHRWMVDVLEIVRKDIWLSICIVFFSAAPTARLPREAKAIEYGILCQIDIFV